MFEKFSEAFPASTNEPIAVEGARLAAAVEARFGVTPPTEVVQFWGRVGAGYFGNGLLYFFGEQSGEPRDALIPWNEKDFWKSIFPSPGEGGPLFFGETCFGDQLGFRIEGNECIYLLFLVDTFESFVVAKSGRELFSEILPDQDALVPKERLKAVCSVLGRPPLGLHYSPIVSPLLGGSDRADNFCVETANVHLRSALYIFHNRKMPQFE